MSKNNFRVSVNLILKKDESILLMRRFNTGWNDGKYALMGGHVEDNENPIDAVIREANEELGLILKRKLGILNDYACIPRPYLYLF